MASLPRIPNASNVPNKKGSVKRSASPVAVNAKLSAMMFRQGGPIQIPQVRFELWHGLMGSAYGLSAVFSERFL